GLSPWRRRTCRLPAFSHSVILRSWASIGVTFESLGVPTRECRSVLANDNVPVDQARFSELAPLHHPCAKAGQVVLRRHGPLYLHADNLAVCRRDLKTPESRVLGKQGRQLGTSQSIDP